MEIDLVDHILVLFHENQLSIAQIFRRIVVKSVLLLIDWILIIYCLFTHFFYTGILKLKQLKFLLFYGLFLMIVCKPHAFATLQSSKFLHFSLDTEVHFLHLFIICVFLYETVLVKPGLRSTFA